MREVTMTEKCDVVIVGARLDGSCAAAHLAGVASAARARGIDVTIVEQQSRYLAARS